MGGKRMGADGAEPTIYFLSLFISFLLIVICAMPVSQNIKVAVDAVVFGYTSKDGLVLLLIKRNIGPFKDARNGSRWPIFRK